MNEETIFATARQWKDSPERRAFLDQACAGDPKLRAQVEALLRADEQASSVLDRPPGIDATTSLNAEKEARAGEGVADVTLTFLTPSDKPDSIGRLGTYEVLEVIGRGGMGIVLRGLDPKLNRIVAIKVLAPEFAANAMARKRFLREAQAAAAVSHDHVVTIHAVDDDITVPFLVMECVIGQSLQQKIDRVGALQLTEILRIGMQIAMGLTAAHKQGLIHRDIKPANILLENGVERVKITDFGLARATDDVGITQSGVIAGTPQYMSPEQAMGEPLDQRSDLFSLGSVLYTMCTGRPAFRADSTIAVIRRVCDDAPRPIRELNPEIPDWLVAIISRLLAKKPGDRFQTAAEVASLLEQHLAYIQQTSLSSGHRTVGKRRESVAPQTPNTDRSDFIWSCVGVVTLVLALLGWFGARFQSRERTAEIEVPSGSSVTVVAGSEHVEVTGNSQIPEIQRGEQRTQADQFNPFPALSPVMNTTTKSVNSPADVAAGQKPSFAKAPFDAQQAAALQAAWAQQIGVPVERTNGIGMKFCLIPPGDFSMGSMQEELAQLVQELQQTGASEFNKFSAKSSSPRHRVRLTDAFYLGQFEVTVGQFRQFADSPQNTFKPAAAARFTWRQFATAADAERQPVVGVSWDEADAFCRWLSEREKVICRLPSEAEWEYACRAGSETLWSFGNEIKDLEANAIVGQMGTASPACVGLKHPNPFGLYDMHGNADEWCLDWHNHSFYGRSPLLNPLMVDPPTDAGSGRVSRGGSWNAEAWWSRSATRTYDFPSTPVHPKGFRVVISGNLVQMK
jgi:serine/threonine protein kinase/formylglycine-generating enzyme required for sulfatase activity